MPNDPVPALLLPGLMNDARVWDAVRPAFGADRQVVVARTDLHDTVEAIAAAAWSLAPAGPVAIGGFSLGGYVALEMWRQAPERVAGLALLDTSARPDADAARQMRQRMVDAVQGGGTDFDTVAGAFLPRIVHPSRLADAALSALLIDMARAVGADGFVRQQRAAMNRPDARPGLAAIACPTLVACGREDQVTPPDLARELAAAIHQASLVVVPECGHMAPLEQPQAIGQALRDWCTRVDA